jgi:hypothetical protein
LVDHESSLVSIAIQDFWPHAAASQASASRGRVFFSDDDYAANCAAIDEAMAQIPPGATVVIPEDGLGTGLAQLPQRAPKTYGYLRRALDALS